MALHSEFAIFYVIVVVVFLMDDDGNDDVLVRRLLKRFFKRLLQDVDAVDAGRRRRDCGPKCGR